MTLATSACKRNHRTPPRPTFLGLATCQLGKHRDGQADKVDMDMDMDMNIDMEHGHEQAAWLRAGPVCTHLHLVSQCREESWGGAWSHLSSWCRACCIMIFNICFGTKGQGQTRLCLSGCGHVSALDSAGKSSLFLCTSRLLCSLTGLNLSIRGK